ncbi:MAG: cupin domain-containing protein [Polyangiales bacterium]
MTIAHHRLLQELPTSLAEEQIDELIRRPNVRIERIVSTGHASPEGFWYDQTEHEWVIVLSGRAKLCYKDDAAEVELGPGDAAFIPAHRQHRVVWTTPSEPTVWLAVLWTDDAPF